MTYISKANSAIFQLAAISYMMMSLASCSVEGDVKIQSLDIDSRHGGMPYLSSTDAGDVYISWTEFINDSLVQLQFSRLEGNQWSSPNVIASSENWFVNWADFPAINSYRGHSPGLVTHWLEMSAQGTYDYDVHISQSQDDGVTWSQSIVPHRDGISAEHGFVSMAAITDDKMAVTWLDGRHTKTVDNHSEDEVADDHHGHGNGAMTLRTALINTKGEISQEFELDNRICDCCGTSTAINEHGDIIVVYRDRSEDEIRDISIVRNVDGVWQSPQEVYHDNWKINGCPVNGPAVSTFQDQVAVAWYTMRDTIGEVKIAFSVDRGANFALPYKMNVGPTMGRVDLLHLDEEVVLISWMEQVDDQAVILAQKVSPQGPIGDVIELAKSTSNRSSGFPKILQHGDDVLVAWTDGGAQTSVKTARVSWQ